jgi:hypothetical protein
MTPETNNVQDVLQLLKELDLSSAYDVYLPSLQKNVKFKQLNTDQLKRLLKTVIDSPIYNTEFIVAFNQIIKENCLEEDIILTNLNILDKLLIFIKMRLESVNPVYTYTFTDEEVTENQLTEKTFSVNLLDRYNNFINKKLNYEPQEYSFEKGSITCTLPTLSTENKLEKELHKNIKLEITTPEELRDTLGDTFINELAKYINSVKINDTEIDLSAHTFKTRLKIVEQLPTTVINNVLKYIEGYKKLTSTLTTIKVPDSKIEKEIPQDATFFNV